MSYKLIGGGDSESINMLRFSVRVLMGERNDVNKHRKNSPSVSDEEHYLEMEVDFL